MTAYIVQVSLGDTPHGTWSTRRSSPSGCAVRDHAADELIAHRVLRRFREVYE